MNYRWKQAIGYGFWCLFCIPLLLHLYAISFIRYIADDYCSAVIARTYGLFGGTVNWYLTWSGRFSANFLDSLAGKIGPASPFIGAALALILWLSALVMVLFQLPPSARKALGLPAAGIIPILLLFGAFEMSPNIAQSLYWSQGMHSVVPPLILATVLAGLLIRRSRGPESRLRNTAYALGAAVLTFLAGGFSETYVAVQTVLLILLIGLGLALDPAVFRKRLAVMSTAGLAGSLVALALVVLAPGNHARQIYYPPPPGIADLSRLSILGTLQFLENILISKRHLLTAAILFSLSLMMGSGFFSQERLPIPESLRKRRAVILLPAAALAVQVSCFVPAAYGTSAAPPARTMIIPAFALAASILLLGFLLGQWIPGRVAVPPSRAARTILLLLGAGIGCLAVVDVSWNAYRTIGVARAMQAYALGWDEMNRSLQAAQAQGETSASVPAIQNGIGLDDIGGDPNTWVNQCASEYFNLTVTTGP
jgi:hypothetical protein